MIVFPAIDLRHGRCVRLRQGDPNAETVYGDDPASMASHWVAQGVSWRHVVNLDGAIGDQTPDAPNLRRVREICQTVTVPIRSAAACVRWTTLRSTELGVTRVVLGTVA